MDLRTHLVDISKYIYTNLHTSTSKSNLTPAKNMIDDEALSLILSHINTLLVLILEHTWSTNQRHRILVHLLHYCKYSKTGVLLFY